MSTLAYKPNGVRGCVVGLSAGEKVSAGRYSRALEKPGGRNKTKRLSAIVCLMEFPMVDSSQCNRKWTAHAARFARLRNQPGAPRNSCTQGRHLYSWAGDLSPGLYLAIWLEWRC